MSDGESDEDLEKAIALSLQESDHLSHKSDAVIDLISDDEDDDDDLDAPLTIRPIPSATKPQQGKGRETCPDAPGMQLSNSASNSTSGSTGIPRRPYEIPHNSTMSTASAQGSGMLGLDRKQMEQERLARINSLKNLGPKEELGSESRKRKADPLQKEDDDGRHVRAKIQNSKELSAAKAVTGISAHDQHNNHSTPSSGIQYPDGIVKKTWVYGCHRDGQDIKIEEVLQKDDLELAVLSAFQIDADWITSKLDDKTKVIWVLQAKSEAEKDNWRDQAPKNYRFCFPSMEGIINCMHSKLQVLAHGSYLRIVIPSANLVPYDWGETGVMENICFLIDLPRLPAGQTADPSTQFGIELAYFLTALGLEQKIVDSLKKYDFSRTTNIAFVHTIAGSHTACQRTGYCGLGTAVQKLGSATEAALEIDFLAASIGNLKEDFIKAMYLACQGHDGVNEYRLRTAKSTRGKGPFETKRKPSDDIQSRCRVYFPTEQTVTKSKGGTESGGTICFQEKYYNSGNFPKTLMRDCLSKREGLLMHSKMIFIRGPRTALAYIGSANLSESAWGTLVKDRTTKEPKLNCRNWECGVLLSIPESRLPTKPFDTEEHSQETLGMDVFDGFVPVPMVIPGDPYGAHKPWYFSQHSKSPFQA